MAFDFDRSFTRLREAVGPDVDLTAFEIETLAWLSARECQVVDDLVSIFEKVRRGGGE